MSVHLTSAVWKLPGMNPHVKLVLLKLADHANDEGICHPSIRRIVAETGISRPAVFRHMRFLREIGVVEVDARWADSGRRTTNLFKICPEKWEMPAGGEGLTVRRGGGSHSETGRVSERDGGGSHSETPINHQYQPPLEPISPPGAGVDLFGGEVATGRKDDADVEALYAAYPRKVDKGHAMRAIRAALKKAPFDQLLQAVQAYATDSAGRIAAGKLKKELIPYPATWFNGERWKDQDQDTKTEHDKPAWMRKEW